MASRDTPKVLIICGMATLTMLKSMTDTNEPSTTVPAMTHLPAGAWVSEVACCIIALGVLLSHLLELRLQRVDRVAIPIQHVLQGFPHGPAAIAGFDIELCVV